MSQHCLFASHNTSSYLLSCTGFAARSGFPVLWLLALLAFVAFDCAGCALVALPRLLLLDCVLPELRPRTYSSPMRALLTTAFAPGLRFCERPEVRTDAGTPDPFLRYLPSLAEPAALRTPDPALYISLESSSVLGFNPIFLRSSGGSAVFGNFGRGIASSNFDPCEHTSPYFDVTSTIAVYSL